jgi:hypothetical protein
VDSRRLYRRLDVEEIAGRGYPRQSWGDVVPLTSCCDIAPDEQMEDATRHAAEIGRAAMPEATVDDRHRSRLCRCMEPPAGREPILGTLERRRVIPTPFAHADVGTLIGTICAS